MKGQRPPQIPFNIVNTASVCRKVTDWGNIVEMVLRPDSSQYARVVV